MKELIDAAMKRTPCDLLFKGGRVPNLFTMEYEEIDVAVKNGVIVGMGSGYEATEIIECAGKALVPGFIEGHMHVESTNMVPRNLAAVLSPLGTTTVMPDPHEIANTCGMEGVRFMERESRDLPIDFYYGAPSCVPATSYETPREPLDAKDIKTLLDEGTCAHLGEMMNFPGVINCDENTLAKLEASKGKVITGHAPGVIGEELSAYIIAGPSSDHECFMAEGALEKLRRGMYVMIRQGFTARNLSTLAPLVKDNPYVCTRCMAVSDDLAPEFIAERGHLNGCMKELMAEGIRPLAALRMVTLTPAEYFGLGDRGAIAPGRIADIVMLDSVEECNVLKVWKRGKLVAENGSLVEPITPPVISKKLPGVGVMPKMPSPDDLKVKAPAGDAMMNVIGTVSEQVLTRTLTMEPTVSEGYVVADAARGIAKMAVVEKNQGTGRTAIGFIKGFGLVKGAIASSVAHDAHNFSCVGMDDVSMSTAFAALAKIGGGLVVALGDEVLAEVEYPVGGLMSVRPIDEILKESEKLKAAREELGCTNGSAFMQLAFMSLSVIPELKLTDQGYFDILNGGPKPLFVK
ncbi:MAG: adenine deaminase [Synergistaceae bacterium]|nr:adenine deaminase [Synergistaceae bacterium]